jgi:hypothetical protein
MLIVARLFRKGGRVVAGQKKAFDNLFKNLDKRLVLWYDKDVFWAEKPKGGVRF